MNQEVMRLAQKAGALFVALSLVVTLSLSLFLAQGHKVYADAGGEQVQNRSIKMSNSTPSAPNQTYDVTFTAGSAATIKAIVIDFCSGTAPDTVGTPIVGDSNCSKPTGMNVSSLTLTDNPDSVGTDLASVAGWTVGTLNSGRTVELSTTGAGATTTAGTSIFNFALSGITNTSVLGTFYARVVTYTDTTAAGGYQAGTEGSYQDYGGFALSTATNISITAKVQETLVFCVTGQDLGGGQVCGDGSAEADSLPNLTIGHGSPVQTLSSSQIDTATAYMQVSTNATTGAVIRMHTSNTCANAGLSVNGGTDGCPISGLDNPAAGGPLALVSALPNTGGGEFGLFVGSGYTTATVAASTGTIAPSTDYFNTTYANETNNPLSTIDDLHFGMVNDATGVTSDYGGVIATTNTQPCNTVNAHLVFGAVAGLTTPAGIYQVNESLIATGQF